MGARKEHRDAQHSRQYFDRLAEEQRYARSYEKALREAHQQLDEYEATVAALQAQVATLRNDVAGLEAENAVLSNDLERERERADRMAGWAGKMRDNWLATRANWHRLSEIVRLALTPEQYHTYRQIVEGE